MIPMCNVCGTALGEPIYRGGESHSLTTMNRLVKGETVVRYCALCDHAQTDEMPDLLEFYAREYEIDLKNLDDDQLYNVVDGKEVFQSDHKADVLVSRIDLEQFPNVLDYGCAKGALMRKTRMRVPGINVHLFDITEKYVDFWKDFAQPCDWAVHTLKKEWMGKIDVVVSIYTLEHIPDLQGVLNDVKGLLRDGGYFYFLVQDMYENCADLIVSDHVNHFSRTSLETWLGGAGFDEIDIDETVHTAAFVVSARLNKANPVGAAQPHPARGQEALAIAGFWSGIKARIAGFEASLPTGTPMAIYGAGVYGNFIFSCLKSPENLVCYLDKNKHLVGETLNGVPIVHPDDLPDHVDAVVIGLNPKIARRSIGEVTSFAGRDLNLFFLD